MTFLKSALLATVLALGAGAASATTYTMGAGNNECGAGGFSNCTLNGSPVIIKFNDDFTVDNVNSSFPSVTGAEFSFSNLVTKGSELIGLDWSYALGAGDPGLTAVALAAGGSWAWTSSFTFVSGVYSGTLSTLAAGLVNRQGKPQGISHITFFDTAVPPPPPPPPPPIPLPAGGLLLLSALGGLAVARRRIKA